MNALRIVAVDDEPLALRRLEWCLQRAPDAQLIGVAAHPREGLELIRARNPDVILLDIEMPELDGFELIEALGEHAPEIIFVTAFDHFAVKAFAASAVDYLLKPVEQARLIEALARARARRESRDAQTRIDELHEIIQNLRAGRRASQASPYETELWIREGDARVRVPIAMIERLQADGDYVRLHVGARVRLLRARFGDLADRLDPERFVRVHRSEVIRKDLIAAIRRRATGRSVAVLTSGAEAPISKRYVARISAALHLRKAASD